MQFTTNSETVLENDQEYINAFLDYLNNFLTVGRFADFYGWSDENARQVITEGRALHEKKVLELIASAGKSLSENAGQLLHEAICKQVQA